MVDLNFVNLVARVKGQKKLADPPEQTMQGVHPRVTDYEEEGVVFLC